jgi:outer membrane receptor protein involved in Fe transport
MSGSKKIKRLLVSTVCSASIFSAAHAAEFKIPSGDLKDALDTYARQTGTSLVFSGGALQGVRTEGVEGNLPTDLALSRLLSGTGFVAHHNSGSAITIVREEHSGDPEPFELAQATPSRGAAVETVTVTSSKLGGADVQSIPISITALSQEQLTATQTNGGPDLVKQVPNLTFSKTNFTGYNIQIRGIGTQAISVTTDPAVAVAFNDIPFIRNHFFEQEFYDVSNVEVLRGPQGTLYGRNATAGVVNLTSAKPTDHYEAMASLDVGNYNNRRMEGMLNIPIVGDKLDLRVAGEWTKRDGYAFNEATDHSIDGRNLWSGRVSLLFHPVENLTANFVWEHFDEDDDRARSTKQLCTRDNGPSVVNGPAGPQNPNGNIWLQQGCAPGPLYGPTAFQTPSAGAIPFVVALEIYGAFIGNGVNPYADLNQSRDLRVVDSLLDPKYRSKNDTFELNADYSVTPTLTLTSQTGFNKDMLSSTEDYNRFNTEPGIFNFNYRNYFVGDDGDFCDPQLGCSNRLVGQDLSQERAQQFSQELRLASSFEGPLNFSVGANYLHYQTVEDYYVFINAITLLTEYLNQFYGGTFIGPLAHPKFDPVLANSCNPQPVGSTTVLTFTGFGCSWIDPNPIDKLDGQGHNYFRSQNPYSLNSWAGFGEVYYQVTPDLKLTGGLRWTDDMKHFTEIPSWTAMAGKGYPIEGIADPSQGYLDQQWKQWTGRFVANWTPKLDFTDQTLVYGSYSRGYKGGGANPPGVIPVGSFFGLGGSSPSNATHPLTFKPEFVDAFEIGTKNTLLDGSLTFNGDVFFYKYQNYQISEIVDRTSVNLNFDAHVKGAEIEATWEPVPGLRFNLSGGYENATLDSGSKAIDLMDRTAGNKDWVVVKPFPTMTSNCILPTAVMNEILAEPYGGPASACQNAYSIGVDPVTWAPYSPKPATDWAGMPTPGYEGFNPATAPNGGQGIDKDLSGNQLPNTPPFTLSAGAQYSMPLSSDWVGTARADGYWQGNTFARIFNDKPYDQIHGYTNVNLSLIFTNQDGWQAMAYMKNVFDTTAITGAFLNTDDTGLTTNVFVTDPRLFGIRITKNW